MKPPEIKIHCFKVSRTLGESSLAERLAQIAACSLADRTRSPEGIGIRLECLEERGGLLFCDFVNIRTSGPGRASISKPVMGFDLEDDEGFGEETAMIFDPQVNGAFVQYNHYGPRVTTIANYVSAFDPNDPGEFEFLPRYIDDIQRKLQEKTIIRKMEVAIAPRLLDEEDARHGLAMQDAIALSKEYGGDLVRISISVDGRGRSKSLLQRVAALGHWIIHRTQGTEEQHSPFKACEIAAKDDEEAPVEVLDLISHKVVDRQAVRLGKDRRFCQESRWEALHHGWKKLRKHFKRNGA